MTYFSNSLWYAIAKNEYRISINSFAPSSKKYFLPLVAFVVLLYPTVITPWLLEYLFDTSDLQTLSSLISYLYELLLLNVFILFLTFPISLSIKDIKSSNMELLLKTPTNSSDILLGEFLGKLPFYILGAVLIGGFLTGIFGASGTNPVIVVLQTLLVILNFLIAYWIGTVIGFYLKSTFSKSARMKDLGKALSFLIIIPAVFVMYGTMGYLMNYIRENSLNSTVKDFLRIFPSSWIAVVSKELLVMETINDILTFDFFLYSTMVVLVVIFVLVAGVKLGNRIYNLEPASFSESVVKSHNTTYKIFRFIGGNGPFGTLLAYNYKNYIRKFENLSKLVYAIVLMFAMLLFFNNMELDNEFSYILTQVLASLLIGFMVGELTIYGKENLLVYRQSPIGEWKFIFSKMIVYALIVLPIMLVFSFLISFIIVDLTTFSFIRNIVAMLIVSISLLSLSVGIFLLNPPFNEKAPEYMLNFQVVIMGSVFAFFILLISFHGRQFYEIQFLHTILLGFSGLVLLVLGKRKLVSLE